MSAAQPPRYALRARPPKPAHAAESDSSDDSAPEPKRRRTLEPVSVSAEPPPPPAPFFAPRRAKPPPAPKKPRLRAPKAAATAEESAELFLSAEKRRERREAAERERRAQAMMLAAYRCQSVHERASAGLPPNPFFSPVVRRPQQQQQTTTTADAVSAAAESPALSGSVCFDALLCHVRQEDASVEAVPAPPAEVERLLARCDICSGWSADDVSSLVSSLQQQKKLGCMPSTMTAQSSTAATLEELPVAPALSERDLQTLEAMRSAKVASDATGTPVLWCDVYRPHNSRAFICNTGELSKLSDWISCRSREDSAESCGRRSGSSSDSDSESESLDGLAIVFGDGCCGKTTGTLACAEERGMEVIEVNTSSARSGKDVARVTADASSARQVVLSSSQEGERQASPFTIAAESRKKKAKKGKQSTETTKRRLFLFEDIDACLECDAGLHVAIKALAETSRYPVVATARTLTPEVAAMCAGSFVCELSMPSPAAIAHWARLVLRTERGVDCSERDISALAGLLGTEAGGVRGVLTTLQFLSLTGKPSQGFAAAAFGLPTAPLSELFRDEQTLEATLERLHHAGIDFGFDNWLHAIANTAVAQDDVGSLRAATASTAAVLAETADFMSCVDVGTAWGPPKQTLPSWHRLSLPCCRFEAAALSSAVARVGGDTRYHWHAHRWPLLPAFDFSEISRELLGLWPGRMPSWMFERTALATLVLPLLAAICAVETQRCKAKLTRRFTHHLSACSERELWILSTVTKLSPARHSCTCTLCTTINNTTL